MRTQEFPFSEGDYLPRIEELRRALQLAKADEESGSARTLLEGSPVTEIETRLEDLLAEHLTEMRAARRYVVLRAIGRSAWRELKQQFPARKEATPGDDLPFLDEAYGINLEAAQADVVRAALVEPTFDSDEAFTEWMDETLSSGEWATLVLGAGNLALGVVTDPKLLPASRMSTTEPS